ncbi:uncharacterized protein LOC131152046 isoform X1 [Malania oleifera]|uniref:uncharacterized protein LOC131152046 isoform X1 n=1 Tax=Malania oleifera TaxID=397392 RepID=UPI0025ADDBC8|nr:uncharacterized protein LOC131152046 isoform X1 [Malania oleifera]
MEPSKAAMVSAQSPSDVPLLPPLDGQFQLSSVVYGLFSLHAPAIAAIQIFCSRVSFRLFKMYISQQIQVAMESMLKMINEIDQNSAEIMEDIEKSKEYALERRKFLEEEKERFQQAAYAALDILNKRENS